MARWFRSHAAKLNSPKVQRLSDRHYRSWDSLLCVACEFGGVLPSLSDTAFMLRRSEQETETVINELIALKFFVRTKLGIEPKDWNGWQYKSDVSTERVKQFRKRQGNVSVTPSESEADTESDTEQKVRERAPRHAKSGTRLPDDWQLTTDLADYARDRGLDPGETAAAFKDYWAASNGRTATKRDWPAAFRTWCRRDSSQKPVGGFPARANGRSSEAGAFARAGARLGGEVDLPEGRAIRAHGDQRREGS